MSRFEVIDYLQKGTQRQQQAYLALTQVRIMEKLRDFKPILAGTIPLAIDVPESDLDILCTWKNPEAFTHALLQFENFEDFGVRRKLVKGGLAIIASFKAEGFIFEIFGQPIPVQEQYGYRHLIVEACILDAFGEDFKQEVINLKASGMKTEPAFAQLLQLQGDPYDALLLVDVASLKVSGD